MLRFDYIPGKGRGIRANRPVTAGTLLEKAAAVRLPADQRVLLDRTGVFAYYFADPATFGNSDDVDCLLAFGMLTFCNHAEEPNAEVSWFEDTMGFWARLDAIKDIAKDEEVTLFYTNLSDYQAGDHFV